MRKAKIITTLTIAVVMALAGVSVDKMDALAGSNDIVVKTSSFEKDIDVAVWSVPSKEVTAQNGKIVFPADSTADARVITKLTIAESKQDKELFTADFAFTLKKLPKEKKFIVGFGLDSIEAYYGEAENIELVFKNDNGVKASLIAYDDSGAEVILSKPQSVGASLGSNIKVEADATRDNKFTLMINGKTIYNDVAPVSVAGRIGFLQTGSCEAEVTKTEIVSHTYDTPENINTTEDFEGEAINKNAVHSKMTGTTGMQSSLCVEEYKGSKVLMFRDVSMGYFGTNYQYSNLELNFDVPYMRVKTIVDEKSGKVIETKDSGIAVTFGDADTNYTNSGYADASEAIILTGTSVRSQLTGEEKDISGMKFYQDEEIGSYSVKIQIIDKTAKVFLKAIDATDYKEVMSYSLGNVTPLGYVHVWSTGGGNFAIDNFRIENKDKGANLTEVEYLSAAIQGTEDWAYEPMEVVYLDAETSHGFNPMWLVLGAGIVGVLILGVCFAVSKIKSKTPKKGVEEDEE